MPIENQRKRALELADTLNLPRQVADFLRSVADAPRCKTCKHWKPPATIIGEEMCVPLEEDGTPMERGFEVRLCLHPAQTFCESPIERDGFGVADGSGYAAVLATAESFGCVRYE